MQVGCVWERWSQDVCILWDDQGFLEESHLRNSSLLLAKTRSRKQLVTSCLGEWSGWFSLKSSAHLLSNIPNCF